MVFEYEIENLRKTANENDAFLNGDGNLYDHDYEYTNEERIIPPKRNGSFLVFFVFQMFLSLCLFLFVVLWKYSMIPMGKEGTELVNHIIDFIYHFHYT